MLSARRTVKCDGTKRSDSTVAVTQEARKGARVRK